MNGSDALEACKEIDGVLADYLHSKSFGDAWDKIKLNSKDHDQFRRNLHVWFDAFQTFKLVHHLRDNGYGTIAMLPAVTKFLSISGMNLESFARDRCEVELAEKLLEVLRSQII